MTPAIIPENENDRLDTLQKLQILDTDLEKQYDEITQLASKICEMPISLISLVDRDRQWFKSRTGLDAKQTPRELAFCAHAILQDGVFEIEDATKDERFHDNPLVTEAPKVIHYAGVPLVVGEHQHPIGTLCVIGHEAKSLTPLQLETLSVLGRQVATHLELRLRINAMKEEQRASDEAIRVKELFMANVSHELRTPLNSIIGFSQVLQQDPGITSTAKEHVKVMYESGKHLLSLINDVLDMSKIEAGKVVLQPDNLSLNDLSEEMANLFSLKAREKGLDWKVQCSPDLPDMVEIDGRRLRQVLINLCGNAIKFTERGEVILNLSFISQKNQLAKIGFEVLDTGPGITNHEVSRLFKAFEQASGVHEGTGLGLSIATRLVALFGGELKVESKEGEGSRFCFEIEVPLCEGPHHKPFSFQSLSGLLKLAPREQRRRVLIVDDITSNRLLCRVMLDMWGFSVREAKDGLDALEKCQEEWPDFILMDIVMPKMGGLEATREIKSRAQGRDICIIAITASYFESPEKQFGNMDDFYAVMSKPFQAEDLFEIFNRDAQLEFISSGKRIEKKTAPVMLPHQELVAIIRQCDAKAQKAWLRAFEEQDFSQLVECLKNTSLPEYLAKHGQNVIEKEDLVFMLDCYDLLA